MRKGPCAAQMRRPVCSVAPHPPHWAAKFISLAFAAAIAVVGLISGCVSAPAISEMPARPTEGRYRYEHSRARAFADELESFLHGSTSLPETAVAPAPTADTIERVFSAFADLPRSEIPRSDLFELKFAYEHWRHVVQARLVQSAVSARDDGTIDAALAGLIALPLRVKEADLRSIGEAVGGLAEGDAATSARERYLQLIALQGDSRVTRKMLSRFPISAQDEARVDLADGPDKRVKIPPSYKSSWPFQRWRDHEEFAEYDRSGGSVDYRGVEFRSGDILIVNLQNPSEGIFTVALEDRKYSPHMAVYVEVDTERGRFPAVYEIHQVGVRLVPLHLFFSPDITSYVEVYRFEDQPPAWEESLSAAAQEIALEDHAFNLFADEEHSDGDHYLTCVTACQVLFERSGHLPRYPSQSTVASAAGINLATLGFVQPSYLAPSDILQWDALRLVGIVDNGYPIDNVARQLVNERFSVRLAGRPFSSGDARFRLFRWAGGLIRREAPLAAPILRGAFGYTRGNFPMGTRDMLGFMELIQIDLNRSVDNLIPAVADMLSDYGERARFSIHDLVLDPEAEALVDAAMRPVDRWFEGH